MAQERLAPDAILEQTEITGGVGAIQDDPDSPDAFWLAATGNGDVALRVSFPTPGAAPAIGSGLQNFRVLLRKNASGGNTVTGQLELWESGGGAPLASVALNQGFGIGAETVDELSWNASNLGTADGSAVEFRVVQTGGAGGNPNNRRYLEVGAVEWNAEVEEIIPGGGSSAVVTVLAQGDGRKTGLGGSLAGVQALAAGDGRKHAFGGSSATVAVTAQGGGGPVSGAQGGSSALVQVQAQGGGRKHAFGGSSASVGVSSSAAGRKLGQGGAPAGVAVSSAGSGRKTAQGGSQALVAVTARGGGQNPDAEPQGPPWEVHGVQRLSRGNSPTVDVRGMIS